ncbi:MAG: hypothetical protein HYW49_02225 [Deltaproteobacteria bacterium]|nr:hypothetical protein [Deltaproteobacteria bacterium]
MNPRLLWETLAEDLGPGFAESRELHRAVLKLSRSFTEGREALEPAYFSDPLLRRAYLAYFLPLGFAKVQTLLLAHKGWLPPRTREPADQRPIKRAEKPTEMPEDKPEPSEFRILDFGCGPGTAALAALDTLKRVVKSGNAPRVAVDLVDSQPEALEVARRLVARFAGRLGLGVTIRTFQTLPDGEAWKADVLGHDLVMAVNVLNELPPEEGVRGRETLIRLWEQTRGFDSASRQIGGIDSASRPIGGSMLIVEPSHRVASQRMVRFRERLLKSHSTDGAVPRGARILGPCMHLGACPVNRTKNWCHFSEPALDSRLQDLSTRVFKDPRKWLKFSYLFFKREDFTATTWDRLTYRAIGDLHPVGGARPERRLSHRHSAGHRAHTLAIDLCRPREKLVLALPAAAFPQELREKLVRGAVVTIEEGADEAAKKPGGKIAPARVRATPMTSRKI